MKKLHLKVFLGLLFSWLILFTIGCEPNRGADSSAVDPNLNESGVGAADLSTRQANAANDRDNRSNFGGFPVQLEFEAPENLRVGEQVAVSMMVRNMSDQPVHAVSVIPLDSSLRIQAKSESDGAQNGSAQMGSSRSDASRQQEMQLSAASRNRVDVGSLAAGESKTVIAYLSGSVVGTLETCFAVDYMPGFCTTLEVVEPELKFARRIVDGEGREVSEGYLCDELFVVYHVENVGTGETLPVTIREAFPNGMSVNDAREFQENIGALGAGETWEERYLIKVDGAVEYSGIAYAETERSRLESNQASLALNEARVEVTVDGPKNHKMFRTAQYQVVVRNPGEVVARDVLLSLNAGDFDNAELSLNTQFENDGETFRIGDLAPGASRTIMIGADFDEMGSYTMTATATGYCVASPGEARVITQVEGVPALRLEMIDTVDPVVQGGTTNYRIRIKNQGTAVDTDVSLSLELPSQLELVGSEGVTPLNRDNETLSFGLVRNLPPGETVEWMVTVRAVGTGMVKTTASMQSNAITDGVSTDEPTNLVAQ